ncbi:MmcQ/YjbR family DNA-binding protein [Rhizobium miluonense]|uniref:Predicted DNA-binding protein, MmcQ/YjbR family n=1 Tax=Rhizobium miluonense TaxID=411945 RepID=A0A1C3UVG8_9HYPH|nr:MmcQ/YjbR family DNA-binding protein [Rhizobium miluonense]SCB19438.1 Predicted DNA-binding protein, MmcQ/YjbR family [Rhizobium miluonense]
MTDEDLIALALSLPEAAENSHFGTRDFRVRGKIFMTLPDPHFCVLKLMPDQQQMALTTMPEHVAPVPGGWGLKGSTRLFHHRADIDAIRVLLRRAWRNAAPKSMTLPED